MEQELRFGLDLGRLALLKTRVWDDYEPGACDEASCTGLHTLFNNEFKLKFLVCNFLTYHGSYQELEFKFIIEQGVEASATSLVARAWPRTHWKAEKGRGMNKCKLGGGVGCMEGTNSGFDTKLVRPATRVDHL